MFKTEVNFCFQISITDTGFKILILLNRSLAWGVNTRLPAELNIGGLDLSDPIEVFRTCDFCSSKVSFTFNSKKIL